MDDGNGRGNHNDRGEPHAVINYATLLSKIRPYRVTDEHDLPWDYRSDGGKRVLHDDWLFFKSVPRINTAFMVPLPFKRIAGNAEPQWVPVLNPKWTFAPGAQIREDYPWFSGVCRAVLTMTAIHPAGQWSRQAVWLGEKNGWTECYYSRSMNVFGNRVTWYDGLKIDAPTSPNQENKTDLMAWFPEASGSIKWGKLG